MPASRASASVVAAFATVLVACSFVVSLDGLSEWEDPLSDASPAAPDTSPPPPDTGTAAPNDGADAESPSADSAGGPSTDGTAVSDDAADSNRGISDAPSESDRADSHPPSIARVQSIAPGWQSSATAVLTLHESAGDLLVAGVYFNDPTATIAVTDTVGSTWTSTTPFANVTGCTTHTGASTVAQIFFAEGVAAGDNIVTVTQSAGSSPLGAFVVEYSGVLSAGSLDRLSGGFAQSSTSTMSAGSLTTTGALDLVVALFAEATTSGTMLPGSGFATAANDSTFYSMLEDDLPGGMASGMVTPTAGEPGGVSSDCWVAAAAAFRAAP